MVVDPAFVNAGKQEGLEIWRIVNLEVVEWPKERYGEFFDGDSYIVLKSKKTKSGNLDYDLHYWIGQNSTQDEYGAVAIKSVELDTFLGDKPVQHREVQDNETEMFKSYFDVLQIKEGGADSGFKHVEEEVVKPRLLRFKIEKGKFHMKEVTCKRANLDSGDVFILDNGKEVHQWNGKKASPMERMKANEYIQNTIKPERGGKITLEVHDEVDMRPGDEFYDRCFPYSGDKDPPANHVWSKVKSLWRISDAEGKTTFKKEKEGKVSLKDMKNSGDVFIFDAMQAIFIYLGKGCSDVEKLTGLQTGDKYIKDHGLSKITITVIKEGQEEKSAEFMDQLDK
ncbi:gelsolin-like protein 1 [Symsagittifera roscoffensis]|uniref:gelsolin-like protein 1 n=1 Tax=Symsagittifera roscoffensis TaxID=84072 RepID=UPI00307C986B